MKYDRHALFQVSQNWIIRKHVQEGNTFFIAQLQTYIALSLKRWSAKSCLIFVPSLHLFLNSLFLSKFSFFNHLVPPFETDLELQTEDHDRMLSSPATYFVGLHIISWPGYRLWWREIFFVFLSQSRNLIGYYCKFNHSLFFPYFSILLITIYFTYDMALGGSLYK